MDHINNIYSYAASYFTGCQRCDGTNKTLMQRCTENGQRAACGSESSSTRLVWSS
jgi:hypothetical protein